MVIELRNNMVYLYNPGAISPVDFFKKSDMARGLQIGKYEVSEYIYLLSRKSWMDKNTLYELARIIRREFPKNTINWEETYAIIEEKDNSRIF